MKRHTKNRVISDFPCLKHIGFSSRQLAKASIKVERIDDALRLAHASCVQEGDGIQTDLRYKERRFHGFVEVNPVIKGEEVMGMVELLSASCVFFDESKETVADMFRRFASLTVIIEVNEEIGERRHSRIDIVVHKV